MKLALLAIMAAVLAGSEASAEIRASAAIDTRAAVVRIAPEIYGHFAEELGSGIDGGIWVGEDSPIPNIRGYRRDIVEALRELKVPVVRWPGGCYADIYHWRDGIGPRPKRRVTVNTSWGGVEQRNQFGPLERQQAAGRDAAQVRGGADPQIEKWATAPWNRSARPGEGPLRKLRMGHGRRGRSAKRRVASCTSIGMIGRIHGGAFGP